MVCDTHFCFFCRSDGQYYDVATSQNRRIYLCMKMTKVSDDLFYFFLLNGKCKTMLLCAIGK